MSYKQMGFTLIELMIVVAIIGILAAFAMSSYQDYVIRSRVSEGLSLSSFAKAAISETFASCGSFLQPSNASYGLPMPVSISGAHTRQVAVGVNGILTITYRTLGSRVGDTLILRPDLTAGSINWQCTAPAAAGATLPNPYRPVNCRN